MPAMVHTAVAAAVLLHGNSCLGKPLAKPLLTISNIQEDEYTCARCKWTAKVLRAALGERRFPRRANEAAGRRKLAEEVLNEVSGKQRVCAKRRFPERVRQRQKRDTMRISFVADDEPEVNGGFRYRDVTDNMESLGCLDLS
eukprot:s772_g17.t1